jgi:hypothetical protein
MHPNANFLKEISFIPFRAQNAFANLKCQKNKYFANLKCHLKKNLLHVTRSLETKEPIAKHYNSVT